MPVRSRIRRRSSAAVVVASSVIAALLGAAGPAAAAPRGDGFAEYVALGDSWTADVVLLGPPTGEYVPLGCVQSSGNYPKQVAAALDVETFFDASCGGATSDNFAASQEAPLGGTNPPQQSHLTTTTDLVTIGIGGNDIALATAILGCINLLPSITVLPGLTQPAPLGGSCEDRFTADGVDQIEQNIEAAEPRILANVAAIRPLVSPDAEIYLVDYMAALPERGCWPYVPILDGDMAWLHEKLDQLNAMVARIAADAGYGLIDTFTPTVGHDVCRSPFVRYVEGLLPVSVNGPAVAVPFHPNSAGAGAQAASALDTIRDGSTGPRADRR